MPESLSSRAGDWVAPVDAFSRLVNRIFALLAGMTILVIMSLIVVAVFFRYVLQSPINGALDISTFLMTFVFFLAIAPALESGSHVEVDLFDPFVPLRLRKAQRLLGKGLTLVFAIIFLVFIMKFFRTIMETDELSFTVLIIPLKYVDWIGPVGAAQFLLTASVDFVRFAIDPAVVPEDGLESRLG
jgi:TRAP-type C4-dicarboxylate transport system permease small subunit